MLTYVGSYDVDAGSTTVHVNTDGSSKGYAYTVTAYRDYDGKKVYSSPSDKMIVGEPDVVTGVSPAVTFETSRHEVGRYCVDGLPVSKTYKGIQFVRYSDGTCRKMNVR